MLKKARILITGGGSGGHILPLLTIAKALQVKQKGLQILYVGSGNSLEKQLSSAAKIPYQAIASGKLRRYFAWKNLRDLGRFFKGICEAQKILQTFRPEIIFSKGGYVSLPVCLAAYWQKIPIVLHESDSIMGLSNKLIARFAVKICLNFPNPPARKKYKYIVTGLPVRPEILRGSANKARQLLNFQKNKPVLLVIGGSQGAQFLNELVFAALPQFLTQFQIIHLCGAGKCKLMKQVGYAGFEYVEENLGDFYALADIIVARAGANTLAEIAALQKPSLLIPLPSSANNHQYRNALYFAQNNAALLLEQKNATSQKFLEILGQFTPAKKNLLQKNLEKLYTPDATPKIVAVIEKVLGRNQKVTPC